MAAPANSTEFLDLVRKSGVTDEKRLDTHLERLRGTGGLPADPVKVAQILVRDGVLTHFQAEQILQGKWRRFTIGKYKVLERIGSGGMGSVYLCEHKLMRRRVAVKVLPNAKAADEASLLRFQREARAAAVLDHPNIVHAYDIDEDKGLHFLVMEYVDGASLQDLVKKSGPLDPVRAAHYIYQASLGLDHAHRAGLVHRDIKPGNVLVDRSGTVKILDMGLARFFHDEEDMLTRKFDENVLGTADYLAPEQAIDSHGVDIRADIYSLGATFYFLLTGRTPFGEGTTAQKLIWQQTRRPRPVSEFRGDVPEALLAVIERMMAKDAGQRYQTPAEVADALAPWVQAPIAPPADRELPQLSLAASGASPGAEPTLISSPQTPSAPPAGPRKGWQVTGAPTKPASSQDTKRPPEATPPPSAPPPARAGRPASVQVVKIQAVPQPPAAQAEVEEEDVPWEQVTSDTEDATARADTAPRSGPRNRPSGRRSSSALRRPPREGRRFWLLAGVVAVLVLALLIGAGFLFGLFGGGRPAAAYQTLRVSQQASDANTYGSIHLALQYAKPGDHIVLLEAEHREQLRLEGNRYKDVTIEPAGGVEAVWRLPAQSGQKELPLLELVNVLGVRVKGIKFDGENRVKKLVRLTGSCPGLSLEDSKLVGFTKTGLSLANCAGDANRPVLLLRIEAQPSGTGADSALLFSARPSMQPAKNAYIRVENCRFLGVYQKSPVEIPPQARGPGVAFFNITPELNLPGAK
jgi:eukaryotic-like serine/threonine-protein kinase